MEIKAPGKKPDWLQAILDKHGLEEQKFSKYSCAYHKSQGLDYGPRPAQEKKELLPMSNLFNSIFNDAATQPQVPFNSCWPYWSVLF